MTYLLENLLFFLTGSKLNPKKVTRFEELQSLAVTVTKMPVTKKANVSFTNFKCLPNVYQMLTKCLPNVYQMFTKCLPKFYKMLPNVYKMLPNVYQRITLLKSELIL